MIVIGEALVQVDQNVISVENSDTSLEIVTKIKGELNVIVAIKKVTLQKIVLRETEKYQWSVINATKLVTLQENVKVSNY